MTARPFRNALALLALTLVGILPLLAGEQASEERMKRDLTFLASEECEGRGVGTKGLDLAADYVAKQFTQIGLKPGGADKGFFQPFPMLSGGSLDGTSTFVLKGPLGQTISLKQGTDFQVLGLSGPGKASAPVVFVGHGVAARDLKYDDYAGIDVKGKVVIAVRRVPRWTNDAAPFDGPRKMQHAELETKLALAASHGAAALVLVNDLSEGARGDPLISYGDTSRAVSNVDVPFVQVRRSVIDDMFQLSQNSKLRAIEESISRDLKPQSMPVKGWTATIDVKVKRKTVTVKNIIGVLEGKGPLANETVVVGAHYDHLGYGGPGSLFKGKEKKIHFGADDNGSGTTAMLELARRFAGQKDRQGRRLVFIAFTAEELGLIGSRYYTRRQPLFPIKDTAAMFNLDMVGRLSADPKMTGKDRLLIEGSGTSKGFDKLVEKYNPGFHLVKSPGGNGPSDHDSFYNQKIPVLFFWTGQHKDYHRPTDTVDKINFAGMAKVVDYAEKVITELATDPQRPEYIAVKSSFSPTGGGPAIPRLGIAPDYAAEEKGILVGSVSAGGPAEKAGIKEGDIIVGIAGRDVFDMKMYMTVMGQQRRGEPLEVTVMRGAKKLQLKAVPQ